MRFPIDSVSPVRAFDLVTGEPADLRTSIEWLLGSAEADMRRGRDECPSECAPMTSARRVKWLAPANVPAGVLVAAGARGSEVRDVESAAIIRVPAGTGADVPIVPGVGRGVS